MTDLLFVSYDFDEKKNEKGICIVRKNKDGSHTLLKMLLDDEAENLYRVITEQSLKFEIKNDIKR